MTRRLVILCLLSLTMLPATLSARYIPPGKESAILNLLSPYGVEAPKDQLGGGAVLTEVKIKDAAIELLVSAAKERGTMMLTAVDDRPAGVSGDALARTPSFALWVTSGADKPALSGAFDALAAAIAKNDRSDFWTANSLVPEEPAAPPVVPLSNRQETPEPDRPSGAMAFILLGLAILLLAANFSALRTAAGGRGRKFWVFLLLTLAIGGAARYQAATTAPARKTDPATVTCQDVENCDDGNPCTTDVCEVGECVHLPDASLGDECCVVDLDCPPAAEHCEESFCNSDINRCGRRGNCFADGQSVPIVAPVVEEPTLPPSTLATWVFTAAGNDAADVGTLEARDMAVISATLALLFLALFLLVYGATSTTILSATFIAAVFPATLVATGATGASGLVSCLLSLSLLAVAFVARARTEGGWQGYVALGFFIVATGMLGWQKPEFAIFPALFLIFISFQEKSLRPCLWAAACISLGLGAWQFARLVGEPGLYEAGLPFAQGFDISLQTLLIVGHIIPFLVVLAALLGTVTAPRGERLLPLLGIVAYLLAYFYAALFAADQVQAVRLAAPLAMLIAIPAGVGVAWIARRPSTYATLCVVILVIYFALFPLVRRNALLAVTSTSSVEQHDREM